MTYHVQHGFRVVGIYGTEVEAQAEIEEYERTHPADGTARTLPGGSVRAWWDVSIVPASQDCVWATGRTAGWLVDLIGSSGVIYDLSHQEGKNWALRIVGAVDQVSRDRAAQIVDALATEGYVVSVQ